MAFAETMFIMAEQYSLELYLKLNGEKVPSPTLKFWKESLRDLSPKQMREGLRGYMESERRSFKPTPGDIKENAPEASDKPRKIFKPDCPDCGGTGFRKVLIDSKFHPGKKAYAVKDCFCVRVLYNGGEFKQPQLPPAPRSAEEENAQSLAAMKRIPEAAEVVRRWPAAHRGLTEDETKARREKMLRDLAEHEKKKQAK